MTQDGGTRGGTFNCEMDCCRKISQGWTKAACSSIPERDGKDQRECWNIWDVPLFTMPSSKVWNYVRWLILLGDAGVRK